MPGARRLWTGPHGSALRERVLEAAGDDPAIVAQWAVFGRYRAVLRQLEAEDADGFAAWASNILRHDPPASWKRPGLVAFLDPLPEARAAWRALETVAGRARSVELTLAYDPDPALGEVYVEAAEVRRRLLEWGFAEVAVAPEIWRPRGLRDVEREVF